jgi:hypothetical protein
MQILEGFDTYCGGQSVWSVRRAERDREKRMERRMAIFI